MPDTTADANGPYLPIDFTLCRLRNTLARLAPTLSETDPATQEDLLEEAIALAQLDPTWSEWWNYATELLPAYQATGLYGVPSSLRDSSSPAIGSSGVAKLVDDSAVPARSDSPPVPHRLSAVVPTLNEG